MTNFFVGRRRRENGEKGKKGKNEILKKKYHVTCSLAVAFDLNGFICGDGRGQFK
jgi:hypothetical protein